MHMAYRIEADGHQFPRRQRFETQEDNSVVPLTDLILIVYRKPPEVIVKGVRMPHVATGGIALIRKDDGIHVTFHPKNITVDGWVYDRRRKRVEVVIPKGQQMTFEPSEGRAFLYYPNEGKERPRKLKTMTIVHNRKYERHVI